MRQLEAALREAEKEGATAQCNWDALHQEEAQELKVSRRSHNLPLIMLLSLCLVLQSDSLEFVLHVCVRQHCVCRP